MSQYPIFLLIILNTNQTLKKLSSRLLSLLNHQFYVKKVYFNGTFLSPFQSKRNAPYFLLCPTDILTTTKLT